MCTFSDLAHHFELEDVIKTLVEEAKSVVTAWSLGNIPIKLSKGLSRVREPNKKNFIANLLNDFVYQMEEFGLYTASIAIMSVIIELEIKKRQAETLALRNLYRATITVCERIRHILVKKLLDAVEENEDGSSSDCDKQEVIWNYSTPKMHALLRYMSSKFKGKEPADISCLIFVERRYTAKCVFYVVKKFVETTPELKNVIRPQFMVGRNFISPCIQSVLERKWNTDVS